MPQPSGLRRLFRLATGRLSAEGDISAELELHVELLAEERSYSINYYTGPESDRVVCVYRDTTEEQLQIRRMLQTEKLAAVGQLAAGVAHEVNNPLGGILAFTELMLRDEGRSEKDMEFLSNVEHAALRCKKIVQSLLKFSRREQAERVRIDVNRAAEEAVVIFKTQLKSKPRARFCQELSAEPLIVDGDANQVEQVVLNLLVNAVQALKEGAGTVVLKSRAVDGHAEIRVEDDGIGIAPEVRSRLFEPAFTTKPPGEGTGFGLAICWRIAESHGGTIDVESEPDKGSAFTFRVPLSQTG